MKKLISLTDSLPIAIRVQLLSTVRRHTTFERRTHRFALERRRHSRNAAMQTGRLPRPEELEQISS